MRKGKAPGNAGHNVFRTYALWRSWPAIGLAVALLAWLNFLIWPGHAVAQDPPWIIFLPMVAKSPCISTPQSEQIALLMLGDPDQQRASLSCNPILAGVARSRAEDMARRGYFSHTNPDGFGPNYLVRQAGYVLPTFYGDSPDANNIESISAGGATAADTWQGWMGSASHRTHLLGLTPFFAEQIEYGVGYAFDPASPFVHYWVVITARPG